MLPPSTYPPPRGVQDAGPWAHARGPELLKLQGRPEGQGARPVMPETEPSPLSETAVAPAGPVPGPGRPVSESAARRSRRVAAPALLAPGSREAENARVGGGGKGARGRRSRKAARGARASRGARTHLHTQQSGKARAAGAPARSAADSCCFSAAPPQPGPGGGEAGRPEAGKGASRGPCVRAGAELAWLSGCAAGWPPAAPARRCLCCSLPLLRRGSAAKRASASGSGDRGKLFPGGWLLSRGSSCAWPGLPARMLPAHSRGCIL